MLITKAPFRVSYFGGGTDYPKWYLKNSGATINTSINKYSYIVLNPQEKVNIKKFRIRYFYREEVNDIKSIKHPTIRNLFKYFKVKRLPQLDLIHFNDLPAQTGIGSSSAFTVGLIKAFLELKNIKKNKNEIFKIASYIEQKMNREHIGSQDQICSAIGGFLFTKYSKNNKKIYKRYPLSNNTIKQIQRNSMLIYSNRKRFASDIAADVIKNSISKKKYFKEIFDIALEAKKIIENKNFDNLLFGNLINESWNLKKKTSKQINTPEASEIIQFAKQNGALGGKILGAGGGGMILIYGEKNQNDIISSKLKNYSTINFKFEDQGVQRII